ncbi:MAG: aminoacyl-tRNA hydrolase [Actinomycetota bacterium]|nr:aminoacyl-tRNA hydrolase [Actinomycetota bacterium]
MERRVAIPQDEIELSFSTSSGPGGQHANRSATRVDLQWNIERSRVLGPRQKERVRASLRHRIDSAGNLRLSSDTHRSQLRNRQEVIRRLHDLVAVAVVVPRKRVPTAASRGSVERRLRGKKRRSETKKMRRPPASEP